MKDKAQTILRVQAISLLMVVVNLSGFCERGISAQVFKKSEMLSPELHIVKIRAYFGGGVNDVEVDAIKQKLMQLNQQTGVSAEQDAFDDENYMPEAGKKIYVADMVWLVDLPTSEGQELYILIGKRGRGASDDQNHLVFPAGKIKEGESPLATIIRETTEEFLNARYKTNVGTAEELKFKDAPVLKPEFFLGLMPGYQSPKAKVFITLGLYRADSAQVIAHLEELRNAQIRFAEKKFELEGFELIPLSLFLDADPKSDTDVVDRVREYYRRLYQSRLENQGMSPEEIEAKIQQIEIIPGLQRGLPFLMRLFQAARNKLFIEEVYPSGMGEALHQRFLRNGQLEMVVNMSI